MNNRLLKINQFLQKEISDILHKHLVSFRGEVVVTEVKVSPNLREAKVFISVLKKMNKELVLKEIENLKPKIQRDLGDKITFKYTPKLQFQIDDSFEKMEEIEKIFKEIKNE